MNPSTAPLSRTAHQAYTALRQRPWLLCAAVLMVALVSTYVHVLNDQVARGERLRQAWAPGGVAAAQPGAEPTWLADAAAPPPAGPDTGR
jgi:hypothetical protein